MDHQHIGLTRPGIIAFSLAMIGTLLGISPAAAAVQAQIPGSFAVSASGQATYSIPIDVPPGSAGVVPSLALSYSSDG